MNRDFFRPAIIGIFLIAIIFGSLVSAEPASTGTPDSTSLPAGLVPAPVLGHKVWNFTTGNWISSSPAVAGGVVYFGSEDGTVYALREDSGNVIWKFPTGTYVSSSPEISNGTVYIGGGDGNLYALDADSGTLEWAYRTKASISSSPAIANGILYVGSEDGNLYALDAGSGALLWNYTTGNYIHSSPFVSGGRVYFGSYDHNVYALDASTGTAIWHYTTGDNVLSSPNGAGDTVYVGSYDHNVYALDAGTGMERWRFTTGSNVISSPAVTGGVVYIGSGDGNIYALDAHAGSVLWAYRTGGTVDSTPLVDEGTVYAGSGDGNLYALNASDGQPVWHYPAGDSGYSSPAIADNTLYIGSYDHNLYALSNTPPVADFVADVTDGTTPLPVRFTDTSTSSPTSWSWDFGDGENSILENPVHTYVDSGTFTVSLTATNGGGAGTRTREAFLSTTTILPPPPIANFTVGETIGIAPFAVRFTDTSTVLATSWLWDFGDGNTSTQENPVHTYPAPGNFTVTLTAKNRGGNSSRVLDTPITVLPNRVRPGPDFSVNASSGSAPLAVQFTDLSTGPGITGWAWDFNNDGVIDSTDQNPVCVYKLAGTYTVNLTVTNTNGATTVSREGAITVGTGAPSAQFAANATTGLPPLAVQFNDTSAGPNITGWAWDFNNDGVIDSTDQNPICVYRLAGNYTVDLTATNAFGSNVTSQAGFITVGSLAPVVQFTANNAKGIPPLAVEFNDTSTGPDITGWAWDFNNDGVIDSTEQDPTCVYKLSGNYTVNLTVTNAFGSNTTSMPDFVTVTNGVATDFTADNTSGTAPLDVRFHDVSTGPNITGWAWDFNNDGVIDSTDQNPTCVYNQPGNYTVSLTVTNDHGPATISRKDFVVVRTLAPAAGFTADNTTGIPPFTVRFNDTSTGPDITGWAWDFNNDGVIDSTEQDPACVYNQPGNYTVSLTVTNTFGSNTTSMPDFVTVSSGVPKARFAMNKNTGYAPLAVQFKDTSTGANITSRAWDFNGDGIIDSTEQNPTCVYRLPGTYTISLTVTNAYGNNTVVRKDFVTVM